MNPTRLREHLAGLVTQLADQGQPIRNRDDVADYLLDLRDGLDDIRDRLDELDELIADQLSEYRIVTKRCVRRGCGIWFRVPDTGPRHETCSDACREAVADHQPVTKLCARRGCGIWFRVAETGRRRETCSDACRQAVLRAR